MVKGHFYSFFSIFLDKPLREILSVYVFSLVKPAKEFPQKITFTEILLLMSLNSTFQKLNSSILKVLWYFLSIL